MGDHPRSQSVEPAPAFRVTRAGAEGPLVGRSLERALLRAALERAAAGRGVTVAIAGKGGIGKTRLTSEFATDAGTGALVCRGASLQDGTRPYGPWAEALEAYIGQAGAGELPEVLAAIAGPLSRLVPAIRARLHKFSEPEPLRADEERFRLFDAVSQVCGRISGRRPLALVLEDLHWADKGTLDLLHHVARFAPRQRLLILATYRDDVVDEGHPLTGILDALRRDGAAEDLRLTGLDEASVAELAAGIAGAPVQAAVSGDLARHTGGNPLFVHEVVQHLIERGQWTPHVSRALDKRVLPASIRALVEGRLAELPPAAAQLVRVAAVFAGAVPFEWLGPAADLAAAATAEALRQAEALRWLRPAAERDTYDFSHVLLRDAVASAMPSPERSSLHRRVAAVLSRAGRRARAGEVALHYHASRDIPGADEGVSYAVEAANQAEAAYAFDETARFLRMALDLLPQGDGRAPRLLGRLALTLARALDFDAAARVALVAAEAVAAAEGNAAAADYLAEAAWTVSGAGPLTVAWELARRGLAYLTDERRDATWVSLTFFDLVRQASEEPGGLGIVGETAERRTLAEAAGRLDLPRERRWLLVGHGLCTPFESRRQLIERGEDDPTLLTFWAGELRSCRGRWLREAERAEAAGQYAYAVECWSQLSRVHTALGQLAAGEDAIERATRLAVRFVEPCRQTLQLTAARFERLLALDEGLAEFFDEQQRLAQLQVENNWAFAAVSAAGALICARLGRGDEAVLYASAAMPAVLSAPAWTGNYVQIACDLAEVQWLSDRSDGADALERALRDKVLAPDFRYPMRDVRLALARLATLRGEADEATRWFAHAREVLDEQGAQTLRAVADHDEALLWIRMGDQKRASSLLAAAQARFAALGMSGWLRRAQERLRHIPAADVNQPSRIEAHEAQTRLSTANSFVRHGEYWTIRFDGRETRIRDRNGVQYLARLVERPHEPLPALILLIGVSDAPAVGTGDLGAILDPQARSEIRARISELRLSLEEAEQANDLGGAESARAELERLEDALGSALGIRGRARRSGSPAERARVNVTRALREAIERLRQLDPHLGEHFARSVRTGTSCSYAPAEPVRWSTG